MRSRDVALPLLLALLLSAVLLPSRTFAQEDDDEGEYDVSHEEEEDDDEIVSIPHAGTSAGAVVELGDDNFDDLVGGSDAWLIEFYAPWCGHCKRLLPVFETVASTTAERGKPVQFGKVDCTVDKFTCTRFEVRSYPTLFLVRDGEHRLYKGEREARDFYEYIDRITAPPVSSVTFKSLEDKLSAYDVNFIFAGTGSVERDVFRAVARRLQGDLGFLSTKSQKLMKKLKMDPDAPGQVVMMSGGTRFQSFPDAEGEMGFDDETLFSWVHRNRFPLVSELSAGNFKDLSTAGKLVVFSVTDPRLSVTKRYLKTLSKVSMDRYDRFVFANINGVRYSKYVSQFGLADQSFFPTLFVLDKANERFYHPQENQRVLTKEEMLIFLDQVYEGKIPYKSIGAWWSPMRFVRWFEKWLTQFSDTQLIAGSASFAVAIMACFFYFCVMESGPPPAPHKKQDGDDDGSDAAEPTGSDSAGSTSLRQRKKNKNKPKIEVEEED